MLRVVAVSLRLQQIHMLSASQDDELVCFDNAVPPKARRVVRICATLHDYRAFLARK